MRALSHGRFYLGCACCWALCSTGASRPGWGNTQISSKRDERSAAEQGSALVATLLLLWLMLSVFFGTALLVKVTQRRIALQSRLDICAVKMVVARRALLKELKTTNLALRLNVTAIYVARGAVLAGPGGAAISAASVPALLSMNRTIAAAQNALLALAQTKELAGSFCSTTPFSKEPTFCRVEPPARAFVREKTLFPDVAGAMRTPPQTKSSLGRVFCAGRGAETVLSISGDPTLTAGRFEDRYEK